MYNLYGGSKLTCAGTHKTEVRCIKFHLSKKATDRVAKSLFRPLNLKDLQFPVLGAQMSFEAGGVSGYSSCVCVACFRLPTAVLATRYSRMKFSSYRSVKTFT